MEAVVVCIDNSEWTRNGDYAPNRFQAQADAVNLLAGAKTEANAENTVGVMTMAGKTPRVLVTPTTDLGKILNSMQGLDIEGTSNLASAVQIAQLALKHRQNKHQRQRIVLFVSSPISEDKETLVKIAKKLKKNNVAVDIVSLAAEEENAPKLEAFQEAVNSGDNSHLVVVPAGTILSDNLYNTPLFQGEGFGFGGGEGEGGQAGGQEGFNFGIDPSLDPELALALRVSLEEENARQQEAQAAAAGGGDAPMTDTPANEGATQPAGEPQSAVATNPAPQDGAVPMEDEDDLLQQALAMSMGGGGGEAPAGADTEMAEAATPAPAATGGSMFDSYDEELQNAIRMSMMEVQPGEEATQPAGGADQAVDPEFLNSVLGGLPGVDTTDPALQSAVQAIAKPKEEDGKSKDSKKDDPKK